MAFAFVVVVVRLMIDTKAELRLNLLNTVRLSQCFLDVPTILDLDHSNDESDRRHMKAQTTALHCYCSMDY